MIELIFILSYVITPLLVLWLLGKLRIPWNSVNIITVFVWNYFIMSFLGNIILFFFLDDYRYDSGVNDRNLILLMHFFCAIGIVMFLVGVYITKRLLPNDRQPDVIVQKFDESRVIWFAHIIVLICIGIIVLFVNQLPAFPILAILTVEDAQSVSILRSMSSNSFAGNFSRYYIFFGHLLPFVCMFYFSIALIKKTKKQYVIFFAVLLAAIVGVTISLERGPIGNLLLGLMLVYLITKKIRVVPIRTLAIIFVILVSILTLSFLFFSVSSDEIMLSSIFITVFSRVFTGALNAGYYYLEYFPSHFPFLYGATLPNPMGFLPFKPFQITVELMSYVHPEYTDLGIVGSMPAPYWAELYANFNAYGVIAGSLLLGSYYFIFHSFLNRLVSNPITIALTAWTILHFKNSATTGATYLIFDTYLVTIYCVAFIMHLIQKNTP